MEISIKNNNEFNKIVRLFGFNNNFCQPRHGNPDGVEIKIEYGNEYIDLLHFSAHRPLQINSFSIKTYANGYKKKDRIILTASSTDANGRCCQIPIILENRGSRYDGVIRVDGNTELFLEIKGNSEFYLDIDIDNGNKKQNIEERESKKKLLIIK